MLKYRDGELYELRLLIALSVAGVIPVALLAGKGQNLREVVAREEHHRTLTEWQLSWQKESRGRWFARLIDNLDP